MITFVYAVVLIALLVAPVVLLGYFDRRHKQRTDNKLLRHFEAEGVAHALQFSSTELLPGAVIGLDGQRRRLLVAWQEEERMQTQVLDLDTLQSCSVLEDSSCDEDKVTDPEQHCTVYRVLLVLQFEKWPPLPLTFFDDAIQDRSLLGKMQQKARMWKAICSQLARSSDLALQGSGNGQMHPA